MLKKFQNLFFIGLHILLGGICYQFPSFSMLWFLVIIAYAVYDIFKFKNENNEAVFWCAYIVGMEVVLRMTGGNIVYEVGKYSIIVLLLLGFTLEEKKHYFKPGFIVFFLLLIPSLLIVDVPDNESSRTAIMFNISGPISLGIAALYLYDREFNLGQINKLVLYTLLPIVTLVILITLRTPDLSQINFSSDSNIETSGGFGPNQVVTILGLGILLILISFISKFKISGFVWIDLLLLFYMIFRAVLTFSRGGLLATLIAFILFILVISFYKHREMKFRNLTLIFSLLIAGGLYIWSDVYQITEGQIENRYSGKNASGSEEDITGGRVEILKEELNAFKENPVVGVGVGMSKYFRIERFQEELPSHNELSRLLAEHGILGLLIIFLIIGTLLSTFMHTDDPFNKAWLISLGAIAILTLNHSAMRLAMPGFIYGLSLIYISVNNSNEEHEVNERT